MPSVNAGPVDCSSGLSARIFNNFRYDNPWKASQPGYVVGVLGCPLTLNGFGYHVSAITTGITGIAEPAWPTIVGGTVVDGGVTWTCDVSCKPSGKGVNFQGVLSASDLDAFRLFAHGMAQALADEFSSDCPSLQVASNSGQTIADSTTTIVVFNAVTKDTDAAYSTGSGQFTVPAGKGGDYALSALATFFGGSGSFSIFKNGTSLGSAPVFTGILLAAGDVLDVRATQTTGGPLPLSTDPRLNFFSVKGLF